MSEPLKRNWTGSIHVSYFFTDMTFEEAQAFLFAMKAAIERKYSTNRGILSYGPHRYDRGNTFKFPEIHRGEEEK